LSVGHSQLFRESAAIESTATGIARRRESRKNWRLTVVVLIGQNMQKLQKQVTRRKKKGEKDEIKTVQTVEKSCIPVRSFVTRLATKKVHAAFTMESGKINPTLQD